MALCHPSALCAHDALCASADLQKHSFKAVGDLEQYLEQCKSEFTQQDD